MLATFDIAVSSLSDESLLLVMWSSSFDYFTLRLFMVFMHTS